jgi:cytoplasmic iron level regulating protein YaaA (DUF328/UPF0246 family)
MKRNSLRILVPSSERKATGGSRMYTFAEAQEERDSNRFPSLVKHRSRAVDAFLSAINGHGHGKEVLGLDGAVLDRAIRTNLAFHRNPVLPVIERENGPLFRALRAHDLPEELQRRIKREVLVICPLLGVLAASDLVPEYRCPVGAQIPELGSLHSFWKPTVTASLNRLCRGRRVLSFLTGRLSALWERPLGAAELAHVSFVRRRGGRIRPENAGAGALAGHLVRHVIENGVSDTAELVSYCSPRGHRYSAELSQAGDRWRRMVFLA